MLNQFNIGRETCYIYNLEEEFLYMWFDCCFHIFGTLREKENGFNWKKMQIFFFASRPYSKWPPTSQGH